MLRYLLLAAVAVSLPVAVAVPATAAIVVPASDAYYTFRGNVSGNSDARLLAGKATAIGFPGQDAISFIAFDRTGLPDALPAGERALLRLEHDPSLGSTLIDATDAAPVSLSAYGFNNFPGSDFDPVFDPSDGNNFDVAYGPDGSNAVATTLVGDAGIYEWDITSLFETWLAEPDAVTALAISGIYGNVGGDGFNAYGIFHTVGSTGGMAPELHVTPLPGAAWLLATGAIGLVWARRRRAATTTA